MTDDIQVLERAFAILNRLASTPDLSLPQIANVQALPFSTTHRIVQSLIARGVVMRSGRGRYRLGPTLQELGGGLRLNDMLSSAGMTIVANLARRTRAGAQLATFDGDMVTYLVKRSHGPATFPAQGIQLEAYCSGIGKVLLAHQEEALRSAYLSAGNFIALTPNTFTDPVLLERELDAVRSRGWAVDNEEIVPGLRCLAVPVLKPNGEICAALSVSATSDRLHGQEQQAILARLIGSSRQITDAVFGAFVDGTSR